MTETEELTEIKTLESEERQTIVHCTCNGDGSEAYRIWPSTYLIEHGSDRRAKLLTAFNISFAPNWTLNDGKGHGIVDEKQTHNQRQEAEGGKVDAKS